MNSAISRLEAVILDENGFFLKIRNLDGCDEEKLNEVLSELRQVQLVYANNEELPKYLSLLLMDLEPVLWGMLDSYPDPEREKILVAIDKLSTAIRNCFS